MDKIITVDIKKCLACKSCEIACALAHSQSGVLEEATNEEPKPQKRVTVEPAAEFGVPIQCRHCESAPCIRICPTCAIQRLDEQSPVLVDAELCIGCKLCMLICPFGLLQIGTEGRAVIKCDMCIERMHTGRGPACVEACPTRALRLVTIEEITKAKRKETSEKLINSN